MNYDDTSSQSPALRLRLIELARDSIGIYPKSIIGGARPYETRTDWMEGWNACHFAYSERESQIDEWYRQLDSATQPIIGDLLIRERIGIALDGDDIRMTVNCSDTFYWGCSDCELIMADELPALIECYSLSPEWGAELWCCRKRGMRPQTACYRKCYPPSEWTLFDACGPERDDTDGRGRKALVPTP